MNYMLKNATQKIRPYWLVYKTALREDGANPSRLIANILQSAARTLLVVVIYKVAYATSPNHVLSYENAMWTIGLCFVFFINLGLRNVYIPMDRDIKSGNAETGLTKPVDWRASRFVYLLGKNSLEFALQLVLSPILLLLVVGPPNVEHLNLLVGATFVLLFVLAVISAGSMFTMVGLSAFWLNDAKSIFRIVDKMALIFCGTFVPLALLPDAVQAFARYSPFGIYAAPTRVFDPTILPVMGQTLIAGVVWAVIMLGLCQLMWQRVSKRIEVNGG